MKMRITKAEIQRFKERACENKQVLKRRRKSEYQYICPYCGEVHMTSNKRRSDISQKMFMVVPHYRQAVRINALINNGGGNTRIREYKGEYGIEVV